MQVKKVQSGMKLLPVLQASGSLPYTAHRTWICQVDYSQSADIDAGSGQVGIVALVKPYEAQVAK